MKSNEEHIDKLFKETFSNATLEKGEFSWFEIDKKVTRMNFMKFSVSSFNIVYASLIGITFIIGSWVGADYLLNKYFTGEEPQIIEIEDTIEELPNTTNEKVLPKKSPKQIRKSKPEPLEQTQKNINNKTETPDFSLLPKDTLLSVPEKEDLKNIKTKVIIKKPDVIQRDTVVIYKDTSTKKNKKR